MPQERLFLQPMPYAGASARPIEWRTEHALADYEEAVVFMETRIASIAEGKASELVWLVEHPPLYTAGTSTSAEDLSGDRKSVV